MTDFVIIQSGNQVESQPESATAIAILLQNDAKDFQMTNHILDQNPAPRQLTVSMALFFTQLFAFRLLERSLRIGVFLLQSLSSNKQVFSAITNALRLNSAKSRVLPLLCAVQITQRIAFSMTICVFNVCCFFLPTSIAFVCFFGRSIGVSATSTITNSKVFSLSRNNFLPGNFEWQQFLSKFSILTMVRETVASDNCQGRLVRWNCVEYSRQYSSVNNTRLATASLHGLPDFFCTRRNSLRTNSQILAKVSGLTSQYRLNNSGESDLMC